MNQEEKNVDPFQDDSGEWYILQVRGGKEEKVAADIRYEVERKGLGDFLTHVLAPSHAVEEIVRGQKVVKQKSFLPGYVFVKLAHHDERLLAIIQNIPYSLRFVSMGDTPSPVSSHEVKRMVQAAEQRAHMHESQLIFHVGERVEICDGPFYSFGGIVEHVDLERKRLRLTVSIFERSTPVELDFSQVKKVH